MNPSPVFMRARTVAFSCIFIASLLWVILLSLFLFWRWNASVSVERWLVGVFLFTNLVTVVMVPLLLLLRFRMWLDIARLILLLLTHLGCAVAFTYSSATLSCPVLSGGEKNVCRMMKSYVLLASWVNPVLLLTYAAGLSYMLYRRSQMAVEDSAKAGRTDGEASIDRLSTPPMSTPPMMQSQTDLRWTKESTQDATWRPPQEWSGPVTVTRARLSTTPLYTDRQLVRWSQDAAARAEQWSDLPWLTLSDNDSQWTHSSSHVAKPPTAWAYAM